MTELYRRAVGDAECCGNSTRYDADDEFDVSSNLRTANNDDLEDLEDEAPYGMSFTRSSQEDCVIVNPAPRPNKVLARGKKVVRGPNRTVKRKPAAIKGKGRLFFYKKLKTAVEIDF